jgi:membrane-bound serine protease (ClpP class)
MIWALLLILGGLMLLIAEVFIPSGGLLSILSILALVAGVVMIFFLPESEGGGITSGLISIAALMVLVPVTVSIGFQLWPKTKIGRQMILAAPEEEASAAPFADQTDYNPLLGLLGKALMPLRPSGIIQVQGRRLDCKTEGMFVEAGQWVRIVEARVGHVIVRPLDPGEVSQLPDEMQT